MKKNTLKAFTLVEMLIVIVIIGILIAALMPRMQSAQWRARDVARKNDLSQIQTAIVTSQQDKWMWPGMKGSMDNDGNELQENMATAWMEVGKISKALLTAGMASVPGDPLSSTKVTWVGTTDLGEWEYGYVVVKKNWTPNWWFVLMAKTEIEWWSNWVYCGDSAAQWKITTDTDIWSKDFQICTTMKKDENNPDTCSISEGTCTYGQDGQLRYIVTY